MEKINNNKMNLITIDSTKEEVANFLKSKFQALRNIEKIADKIIKENITGETLLDLDLDIYKELGVTMPKPLKNKIDKYLEENLDKFKRKPIEITVGFNSKNEEIKNFFKNYLLYEGRNIDNLNGKKMLELSLEEMKNIGLNIGQRIKLNNYNLYTIKHITKDSTKEEVKCGRHGT